MKLSLTLLALTLAGAVTAQDKPAKPAKPQKQTKQVKIELGSVVPASIKLNDIDGKPHSLADYRGKVVVIHFWAYRCPAIRASQGKLSALHTDYKHKNVVVIGIDSDRTEVGPEPPVVPKGGDAKTFPGIRRFIAARNVEYPILVDHKNVVADLFKARSTPHVFVIDQKGVLRYSGALDKQSRRGESVPYVRNAIEAVLAGKKVEIQSTRPYG